MTAALDVPLELPDPRRWPDAGTASHAAAALHALAQASLAAGDSTAAARHDAAVDATLRGWLRDGDGAALDEAFAQAPSAAVHRHLWRRLALVEAAVLRSPALAVALFALPLVIVAGRETVGEGPVELDGMLPEPGRVAELLREHDALGGNRQFAVGGALADATALGLNALARLVAQGHRALHAGGFEPLALAPAPLVVAGTQEVAHLRFLVGGLLCGPDAEPLLEAPVGAWGMPLARRVSAALGRPGVTVLALPRAPQRLVPALAAGRAAQRDVALQLFAGNALRRLRGSFGEPTAVISAHAAPSAAGGGELRVSLSSVFGPRDAEGFRFPLEPYERTPDVVAAIAGLLRDCRVADVRTTASIQPDRDPTTGLLCFCRPDRGASSPGAR